MFLKRLSLFGLIGGIALGASACTDGYGYSGVSVGYGNAGYYGDPYYDGYGYAGYPGYGYGSGFGSSYFGWYGDYYYPGSGVYVYDRYRRPHRWNSDQQRYWQGRRPQGYANRQVRQNWRDFGRDVRSERRDYRGDLRTNRQAYRAGTITQDQFRQGRREARQEYRSDVRQDYRDLRQQNRAQGVRTPRPQRAFNPARGNGVRAGGPRRGGRGPR